MTGLIVQLLSFGFGVMLRQLPWRALILGLVALGAVVTLSLVAVPESGLANVLRMFGDLIAPAMPAMLTGYALTALWQMTHRQPA